MEFTEKDLEKKSLAEISALVRGYEQKTMELATKVGAGQAKPADMLALSSSLVLLKKVLNKKTNEQERLVPRGQTKSAAPLKSYDDFVKNKSGKK